KEPQMRFLRRAIRSAISGFPHHRPRRSAGLRRLPIEFESMEERKLLSIPGVTLRYGNLAITGTLSTGNVAKVWVDPANHYVAVSLNGQWEEFKPSLVTSVTYKSGSKGGDTFVNNTNLTNQNYGYGGHNHFTGGTGFNYVYLFGNYNAFTAQG